MITIELRLSLEAEVRLFSLYENLDMHRELLDLVRGRRGLEVVRRRLPQTDNCHHQLYQYQYLPKNWTRNKRLIYSLRSADRNSSCHLPRRKLKLVN